MGAVVKVGIGWLRKGPGQGLAAWLAWQGGEVEPGVCVPDLQCAVRMRHTAAELLLKAWLSKATLVCTMPRPLPR
jgi:hypothetical protein